MGNENSRSSQTASTSAVSNNKKSENSQSESVYDQYFINFAEKQSTIPFTQLVENFEQDLAESLWEYFTNQKIPNRENLENLDPINRHQFTEKFPSLIGMSTDIYVKILQPVHHFIKVCSDAAGASAIRGDEQFIKNLVNKITSGADGEQAINSIIEWRRSECEKFCSAVQLKVISRFSGQKKQIIQDFSSDLLTPLQMWFVQSSLPNIFFPPNEMNEPDHWTPLYTSLQHGISTNRFETLVFDYKGPTVAIFRLSDARLIVLALDQEWKHSSSKYGGNFTTFLEISPNLRKINETNGVYCNLKLRSAQMGISFKNELSIDKEFNNVHDIEVWGCAGARTLNEQQKLKNWHKQQAEKHKKVPLPGNWDDNPDKTLLELAGFEFSRERENMEAEARRHQ